MPYEEHPPRTVLEQLIRARHMTFEGFSAEAERFAGEHGLRATLSPRHAQRLAAGCRPNGRPLGPVRPVTRRLLEAMFGRPVEELLRSPEDSSQTALQDAAAELRTSLAASRAVDRQVVAAFQQQINLARVIDRRLGSPALLNELREQILGMQCRLRHAVNQKMRRSLAAVLADSCALAGWLSLDQNAFGAAWNYYEQGRAAAREAESAALVAYVSAAQAVVLLDIGQSAAAVELTGDAQRTGQNSPRILRSWLSAAFGEACMADGQSTHGLRGFDHAAQLLAHAEPTDAPYLVFDEIHLDRWRGNALARLSGQASAEFLSETLGRLDRTFTRAEATLRVDLAEVLARAGEMDAAAHHVRKSLDLSQQIGSLRQESRARRLLLT